MPRHRWTLLLIPPKHGRTREFSLPAWSFRAGFSTAVLGVLMVVGSVIILFTPWGTPGARIVAQQNASLRAEIAAIESRFRVLDDTLSQIASRSEQLRLLAGLPVEATSVRTTAIQAAAPVTGALAAAVDDPPARRRPFLGRLGWSTRPDIDGLIARAAILSRSFSDVSDTLQGNFNKFATTPSIMPTTGWASSKFTARRFHPILQEMRPHEGVDVSAPTGTPIVAPAKGTVVFAGTDRGYGLSVEIDHGNGISTRFAHCSRIAVRTGQQVTRGQLIAAVGRTGLATAPHLHYEIHVNGKAVDPLTYVLPDVGQ